MASRSATRDIAVSLSPLVGLWLTAVITLAAVFVIGLVAVTLVG